MTAPVDEAPPLTIRDGQRSTGHGWASDGASYVSFTGGNRLDVAAYVVKQVLRAEPAATHSIDTSDPGRTRITFHVEAEDVAALVGGPMHREAMSRAHHAARQALWACAAAGDPACGGTSVVPREAGK